MIVDLSEKWKSKGKVNEKLQTLNTYERIYESASNIDRNPQDGCMKKIKIERSLKLRVEDGRGKSYNVLTNN